MSAANDDLIKAILAGDRLPVNRAERRSWAQYNAADARRGRRARARTQRGILRFELAERARVLFQANREVFA